MNKWNQKCRRKPKKIGRSRTGIRRKYVENFIICGLTGWGLEILLTSAESLAAGDWKMMGRTSLYMFPIYGLGVLLGPIGRGVDAWIGDFVRVRGIHYAPRYESHPNAFETKNA